MAYIFFRATPLLAKKSRIVEEWGELAPISENKDKPKKVKMSFVIDENGEIILDEWGVIPRIPKQAISFREDETGEIFNTTDLGLQIFRRNKKLKEFTDTYLRIFKEKQISLFLISARIKHYVLPSRFYKDFFKKLKKKKIEVLGYYWQRDVGEKDFDPHFHFIIATSRIDPNDFRSLFENKKNPNHAAVLCYNLKEFANYLKVKKLYAPYKKSNSGKSRIFKKPSKLNRLDNIAKQINAV